MHHQFSTFGKLGTRAAGCGVLVLAAAFHAPAQAAEGDSTSDITSPEFRLSAPEIFKTARGAQSLFAADLNGDSLPDYGVIENENSVLKLYLSKKEEGEISYSDKDILLNKFAFSVLPIDWNQDGRTDLLVSLTGNEVVVFNQTSEGTLASPESTFLEGRFLFTGNLFGDSESELGIVLERSVKLYERNAEGIREKESVHLNTARIMAAAPTLVDFNRDGRTDLLYEPDDKEDELAIVYQSEGGTFPVEVPLQVGKYFGWALSEHQNTQPRITTIVSPTRRLKVLELDQKSKSEGAFLPSAQSLMVFEPGKDAKPETAVVGDITGDGIPEIVVAISNQPFLLVLRITKDGTLEESYAPTYKDCQKLGMLWNEETNRYDVLVLSTEEKVLGLSQWDDEKELLPFSASLKFPHQPVAFSIFGDKKDSVLYVALNNAAEKEFFLDAYGEKKLDSLRNGKWVYTDENIGLLSLPNKDKIQGLKVCELNGEAPPEIVLYQDFKDPVVYAQIKSKTAEGDKESYEPLLNDSLLVGMLDDTKPQSLGSLADGKTLLLRKEFARVIQLREAGVEIQEQLTGKRPSPDYVAQLQGSFRNKNEPGILLLNAKTNRLELFEKDDETELYALAGESDEVVENPRETYPLAVDLNNDGVQEILLLQKGKMQILEQKPKELSVVSTLQTETEEGGYGILFSLPEFRNGMLAALEMKEYSLEFLGMNEAGELAPEYKFIMYNREGRFQRRSPLEESPQPREMISRDFNGDGLADVLCLLHDKIILYTQEKTPQ